MKKIVLLLLFLQVFLFANVAKIVAFNGDALIIREDENIKVTNGAELLKDDVIKTQDNTKLQLIFKDKTVVTIGKNSEFKINDYIYDEKQENYNANLGLVKGTFRTITGKIGKVAPSKFKLKSKSASIGIRGTQILSNVEFNGDTIYCTEGAIEITSEFTNETILIQAGEFAKIREDEPIVVQEFNQEDINIVETQTKFSSDENEEEVIESFDNEIEQTEPTTQVTKEVQEDTQVQVNEANENSNSINQSDRSDDIAEAVKNNSKSAEKVRATFGSIFKNYLVSDYISTNMLSSQKDNEMLFDDNDRNINLKLDNLATNYSNDDSYEGDLSADGIQNISGNSSSSFTFIKGSYTSKKDSYINSSLEFDKDDDIQWGEWDAEFEDEYSNSISISNGYWLTGLQTAVSEVQALMNDNITATYKGYALGKSTISSMVFNATNSEVNFNIDFGEQTLNGTFTLPGDSDGLFDKTLNVSGTLDRDGFTFDGTTNSGSTGGSLLVDSRSETTGNGSGKFYGSNASSIGGNFNLGDGNNSYTGVFKAKKQ
ncbi:MAG: transferrin-binding protein-like solute binding protein [Campylobacterota bacterium]